MDLKDYQLNSKQKEIIKNLVKSTDTMDVKGFFTSLLSFFNSHQLIDIFQIGKSSYYQFHRNFKRGEIKQNLFYVKLRELYLYYYFEEDMVLEK